MGRFTATGQVKIPKEVRGELGLHPGDEVTFVATEAGYVLRRVIDDDRFEPWRGIADAEESVTDRTNELR